MGINIDPQSLEAIADLICGDGQPWYRKGWQLPRIFRNAGLTCPDHDGSTRKWWTLERLREYSTIDGLAAVILRMANPREYLSCPDAHTEVVRLLNQILALDGYQVVVSGVTPRLETVIPRATEVSKYNGSTQTPDFHRLVSDPDLAAILSGRWVEVELCLSAGAYLSAIIMLGSVLEGVLLAVIADRPRQANTAKAAPRDTATGKVHNFGQWSLSSLIEVAHENGWIQGDARRFSHLLRESRNMVHPWAQRSLGEFPDEDSARICIHVTIAALNDLMGIDLKV